MSTGLAQSVRIDPSDIPDEGVIFGQTAGMREIRGKIEWLQEKDFPVLIQGESGTGKELIAKFLHTRSRNCNGPFVKLNCAAIPVKVLESAMLGTENATLAEENKSKSGMLQIADAGSLFLDEIGYLDFGLQAKLLGLIHQYRANRIGGQGEQSSRVRLIFATNVDLKGSAGNRGFNGGFLKPTDLVHLHLLTLRERKEDIPQLCEFFMEKLSKKFGRSAQPLTSATVQLLQQWNWPGNLLELENWIARVVILGSAKTPVEELEKQVEKTNASRRRNLQPRDLKKVSTEASAEMREAILRVLQANGWSRRKTAQELNMSYRSLLYQLGDSDVPHRRRSHRMIPPRLSGSGNEG